MPCWPVRSQVRPAFRVCEDTVMTLTMIDASAVLVDGGLLV